LSSKRQGCTYLSTIHFQDTLGIHYDDLGLYKELLQFIETKAWKVNELDILIIHLVEAMKDVIRVLVIDILPFFSINATAMFKKTRQVYLEKWLIIIQ
jgi:hypothetical protein